MSLHTPVRERVAAAAGTALMVGLLGWVLLFGLDVARQARAVEEVLRVALQAPPRTPPEHPIERPKLKPKAAAPASPRNLKSRATPVVAPTPIVRLAPPTPLVAAPKPATGAQSASGASDRPGPGQGAGGTGNGFGAGGEGDGTGDAGVEPRQVKGRLRFADMPEQLRAAHTEGTVGVRYAVEVDGRVTGCVVTRSSGTPLLDATTCRLLEERFRFKPARDRAGRPVRAIIVESHGWFYGGEGNEDDSTG